LVLLAMTVILLAILSYNAYVHDYVVALLEGANNVTTEVVTNNVTPTAVSDNKTTTVVSGNNTTDYYSCIGYGFLVGVGAAVFIFGFGMAIF
jgi:hypothetical protein